MKGEREPGADKNKRFTSVVRDDEAKEGGQESGASKRACCSTNLGDGADTGPAPAAELIFYRDDFSSARFPHRHLRKSEDGIDGGREGLRFGTHTE